ncbi:BRCA2 and CDKN1A-interacting protein [Sciurus carolinensis]|uniref:BRCA2 and CDKN1A-interacting protein n=1 Tax=Sciurus carolinensis TaxID=30640 RepID=A0AA41NF52_SCICA|nr:BRCA2 and CDKN1A-interacting protein [Sciurus carolinensis]
MDQILVQLLSWNHRLGPVIYNIRRETVYPNTQDIVKCRSRAKWQRVGSPAPRPPEDPLRRDEEQEENEVEDEDEYDEDSEEEEDEADEVIKEEVNVEFEAYSITDNDYDGTKKLLQQLFLKAPVNTAELTDLLIQQNHIGSVIKF